MAVKATFIYVAKQLLEKWWVSSGGNWLAKFGKKRQLKHEKALDRLNASK